MENREETKNKFSERMKNRVHESKDVLFWFCLILGMLMMAMLVIKFFLPEAKIPPQLTIAYPILLAVYVAIKESIRWTRRELPAKLGELLVILWWGVLVLMGASEFVLGLVGFNKERFVVPSEILSICIEVLIIFACSEVSKRIHSAKNNKGGQQ